MLNVFYKIVADKNQGLSAKDFVLFSGLVPLLPYRGGIEDGCHSGQKSNEGCNGCNDFPGMFFNFSRFLFIGWLKWSFDYLSFKNYLFFSVLTSKTIILLSRRKPRGAGVMKTEFLKSALKA